MKLFVSTLLTVSMGLAASVPAFAAVPEQTIQQKIAANTAALADTNNQLAELNSRLSKAKSLRTTTMWIGIPVSLGMGAFALLSGFAAGMSDSPSAASEVNQSAGRLLGLTVVAAGGTAYIVHLKSSQIGELQTQIALAQAKNKAAIDALKDLASN
jgi:hypothetical protein